MRRILLYFLLTGFVITGYLSCKKPFNTQLTGTATGILAVDGPIISGDSTFISLSRTTGLKDTTQNKAELKAILSVEDDQGKLYPFVEQGKGIYALGITNFSVARKYRLDIKTTDGKIYQSDFVPMKVTPPIDSVYFKQTSDATVNFYGNTHDATNNTRYYRWDYLETYGYTSYQPQYLQYVYSNGNLVNQYPSGLFVGHCYATDNSNEIIIGSSAKLASDVIIGQHIGGIAADSRKIAYIYTMRLHEYALTEAGFNYYQNLKTNTEQLGSIFDAQPSTVTGNIHCVSSPATPVIGFVSVSTVTAGLVVLHYNDIPLRVQPIYLLNNGGFDYYVPPPDTAECTPPIASYPNGPGTTPVITPGFGGSILIAPVGTFSTRLNALFAKQYTPYPIMITSAIYGPDGNGNQVIIGYNYFKQDCIDCRVLEPNATLTRPSFFPPY